MSNRSGGGVPTPLTINHTDDPLARFQLEAELFRGRFSVVRLAVDSKSSARCAAKIRSLAPPANGHTIMEEFETLNRVQHDNVVQLLAAYNNKNFLLLFMEQLYENVFERFAYPDAYTEQQVKLNNC